jgi:hypothetical protein
MSRVNYAYSTDNTSSTLLDVPSADACCSKCRLNATCAYWTYQRGQGRCWLAADQGPDAFTPAAGFVSGAAMGAMDAVRAAGKRGKLLVPTLEPLQYRHLLHSVATTDGVCIELQGPHTQTHMKEGAALVLTTDSVCTVMPTCRPVHG